MEPKNTVSNFIKLKGFNEITATIIRIACNGTEADMRAYLVQHSAGITRLTKAQDMYLVWCIETPGLGIPYKKMKDQTEKLQRAFIL